MELSKRKKGERGKQGVGLEGKDDALWLRRRWYERLATRSLFLPISNRGKCSLLGFGIGNFSVDILLNQKTSKPYMYTVIQTDSALLEQNVHNRT